MEWILSLNKISSDWLYLIAISQNIPKLISICFISILAFEPPKFEWNTHLGSLSNLARFLASAWGRSCVKFPVIPGYNKYEKFVKNIVNFSTHFCQCLWVLSPRISSLVTAKFMGSEKIFSGSKRWYETSKFCASKAQNVESKSKIAELSLRAKPPCLLPALLSNSKLEKFENKLKKWFQKAMK